MRDTEMPNLAYPDTRTPVSAWGLGSGRFGSPSTPQAAKHTNARTIQGRFI